MTEEHVSKNFSKKGLLSGPKAPLINIKDVFGKEFDLIEELKEYDAVLIDFFRGAW